MQAKRLVLLCVFALAVTQAGAQWQQIRNIEGGVVLDLERINGVIWAATYGGLYKSWDQGRTWHRDTYFSGTWPISSISVVDQEIMLSVYTEEHYTYSDSWSVQIFRSSDGGVTWQSYEFGPGISSPGESLDIFRVDGVLMARYRNDLYLSEDNGQSWEYVNYFENGYIGFPFSFAQSGDNLLMITHLGQYLSNDRGFHWELLDSMLTDETPVFEDSLIIIATYDSIVISQDLGQSWNAYPLPDGFYDGKIQRGSSGKLYALSEYISVSTDNGKTWSVLNDEYKYQTPYLVVETPSDELVLGTTRGCYYTTDNGATRHYGISGFRPVNVRNVFMSPFGDICIYTNVGVFKSDDYGMSWTDWQMPPSHHFEKPLQVEWLSPDSALLLNDRGLFLATGNFQVYQNLMDPIPLFDGILFVSEDTIYVSDDRYLESIWRSTDFGVSWEIKSPAASDLEEFYMYRGILYTVTDRGCIYRSSNGGDQWDCVATTGPSGGLEMTGVADRLLLTGSQTWMYSENNGVNWSTFNPEGLPFSYSYDIQLFAFDKILFASHETYAIYASFDLGDTWQPFNEGLSSFWINNHSLSYGNNIMAIGTRNAGLWLRDISELVSVTERPRKVQLQVVPNPARGEFNITLPGASQGMATVRLADYMGQTVYRAVEEVSPGAPVQCAIALPAGVYMISLRCANQEYTGKLVIHD